MVIPEFRQFHATEPEMDRLQQNIEIFTGPLINVPFLKGNLLESVQLGTTETQVQHKLGLAYQGFLILNKNAQSDIWVSSETENRSTINLTASATVTTDVWVF